MLGCLVEKQRTTPDVYPLSLNSLRAACNQSTNRDPVVQYDEATIRDALHRLARRRWTRFASGARAAKYRHLLAKRVQRRRASRCSASRIVASSYWTTGWAWSTVARRAAQRVEAQGIDVRGRALLLDRHGRTASRSHGADSDG